MRVVSIRRSDYEHTAGVEQLDRVLDESQADLQGQVLDQLEHQDRVDAVLNTQEIAVVVIVARL